MAAPFPPPLRADRVEARACAKAILAGEHFVVYGAPALAVPLDGIFLRVEVSARPGAGVELEGEAAAHPVTRAMCEQALGALGRECALRVRIRSDIPVGAGLGSSAALAVALVRAAARLRGEAMGIDAVDAAALDLERLAHGRPSGVDNAVVAREVPVWFERGSAPRPLVPRGVWHFVLADTGARAATAEVVEDVRRWHGSHTAAFGAAFEAAVRAVRMGADALRHGDVRGLGAAMNQARRALFAIGVSTEAIEALCDAALEAGAVGAKLTGAGRGGCVLALAETAEAARNIARAFERAGAVRTWQTVLQGEVT